MMSKMKKNSHNFENNYEISIISISNVTEKIPMRWNLTYSIQSFDDVNQHVYISNNGLVSSNGVTFQCGYHMVIKDDKKIIENKYLDITLSNPIHNIKVTCKICLTNYISSQFRSKYLKLKTSIGRLKVSITYEPSINQQLIHSCRANSTWIIFGEECYKNINQSFELTSDETYDLLEGEPLPIKKKRKQRKCIGLDIFSATIKDITNHNFPIKKVRKATDDWFDNPKLISTTIDQLQEDDSDFSGNENVIKTDKELFNEQLNYIHHFFDENHCKFKRLFQKIHHEHMMYNFKELLESITLINYRFHSGIPIPSILMIYVMEPLFLNKRFDLVTTLIKILNRKIDYIGSTKERWYWFCVLCTFLTFIKQLVKSKKSTSIQIYLNVNNSLHEKCEGDVYCYLVDHLKIMIHYLYSGLLYPLFQVLKPHINPMSISDIIDNICIHTHMNYMNLSLKSQYITHVMEFINSNLIRQLILNQYNSDDCRQVMAYINTFKMFIFEQQITLTCDVFAALKEMCNMIMIGRKRIHKQTMKDLYFKHVSNVHFDVIMGTKSIKTLKPVHFQKKLVILKIDKCKQIPWSTYYTEITKAYRSDQHKKKHLPKKDRENFLSDYMKRIQNPIPD